VVPARIVEYESKMHQQQQQQKGKSVVRRHTGWPLQEVAGSTVSGQGDDEDVASAAGSEESHGVRVRDLEDTVSENGVGGGEGEVKDKGRKRQRRRVRITLV
jgi:hypothetical protein